MNSEYCNQTTKPSLFINCFIWFITLALNKHVFIKHEWHLLSYFFLYAYKAQFKDSIWTASSEFGSYRLCEQRRFMRACASAQSRQNLRCSLIQAVNQEEPSDRKPDPWPLWMAGHAQLKFVMMECSKTQIRLMGLIYRERNHGGGREKVKLSVHSEFCHWYPMACQPHPKFGNHLYQWYSNGYKWLLMFFAIDRQSRA